MLRALGLSPSEEDLYTVLIRSPRSTVAELAAYGARPWQVELTALPIAKALLRLAEKDAE